MKIILATNGQEIFVDDEDYEELSKVRWFIASMGYAVRNINGTQAYMHRLLTGATGRTTYVDHRNRNKLDNQKSNLRVANASQNGANRESKPNTTSKYLGVSLYRGKKWRAYIKSINLNNGKNTYLGTFDTEIEAACCYNRKAKELHGEFANLNTV